MNSVLTTQFRQIKPIEIKENVFKLVGADWTVISAGTGKDFNSMTASWGGMGIMWGRASVFIFVRNARHTYKFLEREKHYTLSFFDHAKYKDALMVYGTKSGRDTDREALTGLTPIDTPNSKAYAESELIIECSKFYADSIRGECALLEKDQECSKDGFHKLYIGEITGVWERLAK